MHPFRHLPQVAIDMLQKPMGVSSDISVGASYPADVVGMPADSEDTFYVPLISDPLVANHVFAGAFRSDKYLRVWLAHSISPTVRPLP